MIVVTGASRGLGRAISDRLTSKGFEVIGIARHNFTADFQTVSADVSDADSLKSIAKSVRRQNKPITAVINAAGIASMNLGLTTPASEVARIAGVNLFGTIYSCQAFGPLLIRNRAGSIINFSTIAVHLGLSGESVYSATKAGVEAFSRAFARELSPHNINVHCIAPGPIRTDLLRGVSDEQVNRIVSQQVFQREFTPEAVCDVAELLLDDRSRSLSGQTFHIGGV